MPTTIPKTALVKSHGLNVGSGPHYAEGWINLDVVPAPEGTKDPDVIASVFSMDHHFPDAVFEKAYVGHVLEHLPWPDVAPALRAIARKVIPGGTIMVVGPCVHRAIETRQPRWLIEAILADPREEGPWSHAWTPTTDLTVQALQDSGLQGVRECPVAQVGKPGWPNPSTASWQVAAFGFAPGGTP